MNMRAVAMQCNASLHGQDTGLGDTSEGTSPGPSVCQRSLVCFSLHCFHLLSIFWEGNGGCSGVCIMPRGMLGEVTQQIASIKAPWTFFPCRHLC